LNSAHSLTIESFLIALEVWPWNHGRRDTIPDVPERYRLTLGALVIRVYEAFSGNGTLYFVSFEADVLDRIENLYTVDLPIKFSWFAINCG
jgi:hypothetical protein